MEYFCLYQQKEGGISNQSISILSHKRSIYGGCMLIFSLLYGVIQYTTFSSSVFNILFIIIQYTIFLLNIPLNFDMNTKCSY